MTSGCKTYKFHRCQQTLLYASPGFSARAQSWYVYSREKTHDQRAKVSRNLTPSADSLKAPITGPIFLPYINADATFVAAHMRGICKSARSDDCYDLAPTADYLLEFLGTR